MSSITRRSAHLLRAFNEFGVRDFLRLDLPVGIAGGAGATVLAIRDPDRLLALTDAAVGIVGVIVGAVLAGASIQAAFLDNSFLRKLAQIERDPVRYLLPFLFTAMLGVWAMLALLVLGTLKPCDPEWLLVTVGGVSGFLTCYTVASLLPGLSTLVQFIGLRQDAALVPDAEDDAP